MNRVSHFLLLQSQTTSNLIHIAAYSSHKLPKFSDRDVFPGPGTCHTCPTRDLADFFMAIG